MLEKLLDHQQYPLISTPSATTCANIQGVLRSGNNDPVVAEIGIGIGATTREICRILDNRGELHIYDFEGRATELRDDLHQLGYTNVIAFENSGRHWDSYNWSLARHLKNGWRTVYDYIYLDGAHTLLHDGLAFFLCDKLLKPGGLIEFDDYNWVFKRSKWMLETREQFMTDEQIEVPQVALVVDLLVKAHPDYECVTENRVFRKVREIGTRGE